MYQISRCWIIYGKRWPAVVIPVVLWLYNFTSIIVILYWTASGDAKSQVVPFTLIYPDQRIVHMHEGFAFATVVIGIYVTCMFGFSPRFEAKFALAAIIIRIYRNSVPRRRLRDSFFLAIRLVAESGFIYVLASILLLCALLIYDSPSGSQYPLLIISDMVRYNLNGYVLNY